MFVLAALVTLALCFACPDLAPLAAVVTLWLHLWGRRGASLARARARDNERRAHELILAVKRFK